MIGIVNITRGGVRPGVNRYEVRLNDIPLVRFNHVREDGMRVCLHKAAEAIGRTDVDKVIQQYRIERLHHLVKELDAEEADEKVEPERGNTLQNQPA